MRNRASSAATILAIALMGTGCGGDDTETITAEAGNLQEALDNAVAARQNGSGGQIPTPNIGTVEQIQNGDDTVTVMRIQPPGFDSYLGMAAHCTAQQPVLTIFLGPFPHDYRAVQLAVRAPDGRTEHFGRIVRAGAEHGYHSPLLENEEDIAQFTELALQTGALISNGYNSFFNQADPADNSTFRDALSACG